jgi:hypothetical protein
MTNKPSKPTVIQTLLEAGAHFDTVNNEKKAFFHMLKGQPLHEVRQVQSPPTDGVMLLSLHVCSPSLSWAMFQLLQYSHGNQIPRSDLDYLYLITKPIFLPIL